MQRTRSVWESVTSWRHGIRPRVLAAYVVLLAAALLVANVAVRQVLLARLDRSVDAALGQEVEELRRLVGGTDPETGQPFGDDVEAVFDTFLRRNVPSDGEAFYTFVDGAPFLTSFEPPLSVRALMADERVRQVVELAAEPVELRIDTEVGEARLLAVPIVADAVVEGEVSDPSAEPVDEVLGTFVVAFFTADERDEVAQAWRLVAVVSIIVLVATTVAAWSLAGRVVRPVARLTETASRITDTDLSERIPVDGHDELAQLTHTFNSMLGRLESAAVSQRRFLNDIAHDLRTPLTIVRGHLDMLDDDPDQRAETIALVADELDRMGRYVSDLLVLAKAEQPDFLQLGLVDVGEWAADVAAKAQHLGDATVVLGEVPPPGAVIAELDEERLTQAVLNLFLNAAQHTGVDDEIRLDVEPDGDRVWIRVSDTGPGVEPELLVDLFDRTTRGDRSRESRRDGTGLGLAIVRAVAEAHRGSVRVESEPGMGATFVMELPLDPEGVLRPEEVS